MTYGLSSLIIYRGWLKRYGTNDKCHDNTVISGGALAKKGVFGQTLLYVACTRSRDHLLVTGVEPASEFLGDLLQER